MSSSKQLAAALRAVAHEHGLSSWRALKAELDQRQETVETRASAVVPPVAALSDTEIVTAAADDHQSI